MPKSELFLRDTERVLDPERRELEPVEGAMGLCLAEVDVKAIDNESRTVPAMASTPSVDRYGEIVEPEAYQDSLPQFMRNPVLVAGHVYSDPRGWPTGIGTWSDLQVGSDGLRGKAHFMRDDPSGLADAWWARYQQKVTRAFSVGFIAKKLEFREFKSADNDRKHKVRVFTKVELLEISAVEIPANRESLVLSALGRIAREPGGAETTRCPDKGSVRELLPELIRGITPDLVKAIKEQLNAEPGGLLCELIRDVISAHAAEAHGGHDIHDARHAAGPRAEAMAEFTRELRSVLG